MRGSSHYSELWYPKNSKVKQQPPLRVAGGLPVLPSVAAGSPARLRTFDTLLVPAEPRWAV